MRLVTWGPLDLGLSGDGDGHWGLREACLLSCTHLRVVYRLGAERGGPGKIASVTPSLGLAEEETYVTSTSSSSSDEITIGALGVLLLTLTDSGDDELAVEAIL